MDGYDVVSMTGDGHWCYYLSQLELEHSQLGCIHNGLTK